MKKLLATIVSCFVPGRVHRHAVRDAIKYGKYKKRLETIRKIKTNNKKWRERGEKPKYNLAVCAIMKNEGPYLKEWVEYHKMVGVEKFYLYDNESNDDTKKILSPYIKSGLIEYIFRPGQKQQIPAYKDCVEKHKFEARWIAFIDLDEYIIPVKHEKITQFLDGISDRVGEIIIDWAIYGSSGHETKPRGLVLENYVWRAKKSWLYKSIINPRLQVDYMSCHDHDVIGRVIHVSPNIMRVNHYHCKSWEEYQKRATRGDAYDGSAAGLRKYQRATFDRHDINEIRDEIALKYVKKLKDIIKK